MKTKAWLLTLVASLGAGVVLAQDTNLAAPLSVAAPAAPAPTLAPAPSEATTEPAKPTPVKPKKKAVKKPTVKSSGLAASHSLLDPSAPARVKVESLNVRGLPSLSGEVITKLRKGETVTVIEEITLDKVREGEPAKWVRITLPTNTPVWVAAHLVDPATKAVLPNRLNVRGGPGEDYNVVGHLEKGTIVKEVKQHESWLQIETPTNVTGYTAADFVEKQDALTPVPAAHANALAAAPTTAAPAHISTPAPIVNATPVPVPTEVVNVQPDTRSIVMPAIDPTPAPVPPAQAPTMPAPSATAAAVIPAPVVVTPEPVAVTPAPELATSTIKDTVTTNITKRIVTREGVVRQARNIAAPTYFELRDATTGELLDYLNPTKAEIELNSYIGQKVTVTGEEAMDHRWKYTPVVEIETIDLL